MKKVKILSFLLVLIILMSSFAFAIPVSAAVTPTYSTPPIDDNEFKLIVATDSGYTCFSYNSDSYAKYYTSDGQSYVIINTRAVVTVTATHNRYYWDSTASVWESSTEFGSDELLSFNSTSTPIECNELIYYNDVDIIIEEDNSGNSGSGGDSSGDSSNTGGTGDDNAGTDDTTGGSVEGPDEVPDVDPSLYSGVLADLRSDKSFVLSDYPFVSYNYNADLIQLAESVNGEVFLYVYQPYKDNITLRTVRIMRYFNGDNVVKDYELQLLNSNGVFYKYLVKGLSISETVTRTYDIICFHRDYIRGLDPSTSGDDSTDLVAINVSERWTASTVSDSITYSSKVIETIVITSLEHDFIRYLESGIFSFYTDACDAHYLAFSTDRDIGKLLEAEVSFVTQKKSYTTVYHCVTGITDAYFDVVGDEIKSQIILYHDDRVSTNNSIFYESYSWERIQSVAKFLNTESENLTSEQIQAVSSKEWVLRFVETDFEHVHNDGYNDTTGIKLSETDIWNYTDVNEVTILRLKFETDGKVYNLGAVSNVVSDDGEPGGTAGGPTDIEGVVDNIVNNVKGFFESDQEEQDIDFILGIVLILALCAVAYFAFPYIKAFLAFVGEGFVFILQLLLNIVLFPITLIMSLFDD